MRASGKGVGRRALARGLVPVLLVLLVLPTAASAAVKEFVNPIPAPLGLAAGPDGALWYTGPQTSFIGRISTTGATKAYPITPSAVAPQQIATGPDGALWYTMLTGVSLGRITTAGVMSAVPLPIGSVPAGVTIGPDNVLWYTNSAGRIGRLADGKPTETRIPSKGAGPTAITTGPDGALWFTQLGNNRIGRVTTGLSFSVFTIPTSDSAPSDIVAGPDGALWFTEQDANKVARITTAGAVTEYALPTPGALPRGIAVGPDNALWVAEYGADQIARVALDGKVTEYPLPDASTPSDVASGPDGGIWFTETGADKIGRLDPSGAPAARGPSVACSTSQPFGPKRLNAACRTYHLSDGKKVKLTLRRGKRVYDTTSDHVSDSGLGVVFHTKSKLAGGEYVIEFRISSKLTLTQAISIAS